jgi:hypothetical protein
MVLETHIAADVAETDEDIGAIGRLAVLNANDERNSRLAEVERHLIEILSADFDLARMQANVLVDEGDQLPSQAKNNNICPQNVRSEIAAAAVIGLPAPRRLEERAH